MQLKIVAKGKAKEYNMSRIGGNLNEKYNEI
jgi:hypothetical protein